MHTPSPYEEVFVRRNAVLLFLHRFGWGFALTVGYCDRRRYTTGRYVRLTPEVSPAAPAGPSIVLKMMSRQLPHLEYCPLHDVFDEERGCLRFRCCIIRSSVPCAVSGGSRRSRPRLAMGKPGRVRRGNRHNGEGLEGTNWEGSSNGVSAMSARYSWCGTMATRTCIATVQTTATMWFCEPNPFR